MKTSTIVIIAAALLGAATALLVSLAALLFQGGIIADATGGVGELLPVQASMGVAGLVLLVTSAILFIFAAARRNRRAALAPQTR